MEARTVSSFEWFELSRRLVVMTDGGGRKKEGGCRSARGGSWRGFKYFARSARC